MDKDRHRGRGIKRVPAIAAVLRERYARLSKADWCDIAFQAIRQVFWWTPDLSDEAIMTDAERRAGQLRREREGR